VKLESNLDQQDKLIQFIIAQRENFVAPQVLGLIQSIERI
jgi:hypothetical protein